MKRTLLGLLVGVCLVGATPLDARMPRVRPLSDRGARLVQVGRDLSPTIRAMLERVERSDIILQIEVRLSFDVPNAVTRLVTSTPGFRYVRVTVNPRLAPARRLELLAHELQHVLEIASDLTVRDQNAMRQLFSRIGKEDRVTGAFETWAAVDVEHVVRREVGTWGSRGTAGLGL